MARKGNRAKGGEQSLLFSADTLPNLGGGEPLPVSQAKPENAPAVQPSAIITPKVVQPRHYPSQKPIIPNPPGAYGNYIAISGNMGSGKTSLVDFLSKRYNIRPYYEPNEQNPYLDDYYKDMPRWAFQSQVFFLSHRLRIHMEVQRTNTPAILDRTIYEDAEIFALNCHRMGFLDERDFRAYWDLYRSVSEAILPPRLMVYLRCPPKSTKKRILIRGREMEKNVPTEYLTRLHRLYDNMLKRYSLSPVLVLDTGKLDYITDLVDRADLIASLDNHISSLA